MTRALLAFALVLACGPGTSPPPPKPATPAQPAPEQEAAEPVDARPVPEPVDPLSKPPSSTARPPLMVAELVVPDYDGMAAALRGYLAATGSQMFAGWTPEHRTIVRELIDSPQLELDWNKPLAIYAFPDGLSPPKLVLASYSKTKPTNIARGARIHREGPVWLIGEQATIDGVRGYAATRAISPGPGELIIYPEPTWSAYQAAYQMVAGAGMSADDRAVFDALIEIVRASDRLVISAEINSARAELAFALEPRAGTPLARFGGMQKASAYKLVDYLPDHDWSVVAAGQFYVDEKTVAQFSQLASAPETIDDLDDMDTLARQLWDTASEHAGEFAWAAELLDKGSEIAELIKLRNATKARSLIDGFANDTKAPWDKSPVLTRAIERDRRVGGVAVKAMTVRPTADKRAKPWWFRYGTTAGYLFGAAGKRSNQFVRQLITAARRAAASKPPRAAKRAPGLVAALTGSRQRGESMVVWLDIGGIARYTGKTIPAALRQRSRASGLVIGLPMNARSIGLRITMPAEQLAVAMTLAQ